MDLKVGDIVRLKSGGPKMTVNKLGPFDGGRYANPIADDAVEVIFVRQENEGDAWLDTHTASVAALVKVDP